MRSAIAKAVDRLHVAAVVSSPTFGGGEKYLVELCHALEERGYSYSVVGGIPTDQLKHVHPTGPNSKWTLKRPVRSMLYSLFHCFRASWYLVRNRSGIDVVHLQYKQEQILLTRFIARFLPVVWTEHGVLPGRRAGLLLSILYKWSARGATKIVAVSDLVYGSLMNTLDGAAIERVQVIENSVDRQHFSVATPKDRAVAFERFGFADGENVGVVVSRLHESKRVDLCVEGVLSAGWSALVVGDGPAAPDLRARYQGSGRVRFAGHLDDVRPAYAVASAVLLGSQGAGEGYPLSMLEAQSCGVPVLAMTDSTLASLCLSKGGHVSAPVPEEIGLALKTLPHRTASVSVGVAESSDRWLAHIELFLDAARGQR